LCIFRLPTADDETSLAVDEVASALREEDSGFDATISASQSRDSRAISVAVANAGTRSPLPDHNAIVVDVAVPAGRVRDLRVRSGVGVRFLAASAGRDVDASRRRANVIRLTAARWRPGERLEVEIELDGPEVATLDVTLAVASPDVPTWRLERTVEIEK
jgi:hypothetical protein